MDCTSNTVENKKPYEPPQLAAISLRPEEAVLGHCKVAGGGGGLNGICGIIFGGCQNTGS